MRPFLIDTDTGSDDAVALVMALTNPEIRVEAITVVAGNVPLEQGVQNALYTVERTGANVPVYQGMGAPLLRPHESAQHVHGSDGTGDIGPGQLDGVERVLDALLEGDVPGDDGDRLDPDLRVRQRHDQRHRVV